MLSPEISRLLAYKRQIAVYNNDFEMIKKIESIKSDNEVDLEIMNYKSKK